LNNNPDASPQAMFEAMAVTIRAQVIAEQSSRKPVTGPRLLNAKKAAEYLGRTESAVRHLIHKKILPVVRFDRAIRIDVRDLDRLIDDYRA